MTSATVSRLIASEVECIEPKAMPKLPVASALWVPQPTFEIGAGAWILAGGTHHSAFSYDITAEYWEDFCEILGIEFVNIDKNTTISSFKQQLLQQRDLLHAQQGVAII